MMDLMVNKTNAKADAVTGIRFDWLVVFRNTDHARLALLVGQL